jgi:hypothetical protein
MRVKRLGVLMSVGLSGALLREEAERRAAEGRTAQDSAAERGS